MTGAYFRRRQHAKAQKVAAFFLAFVASLAAADPAPPSSQPVGLPADSTTADVRTGLPGNTPLKRQPVAMPDSAGPGITTDIEILHRFNEHRHELLDHREKTVDWWLAATAIFLTLLGIVAVIAGYLSFKRFSEIEVEARENVKSSREYAEEARNLVSEIMERRDEAKSLVKRITAEAVHNDPDEARRAAENVQENPTASPIYQAVAAAVLLQSKGNIEEAIEKWRTIANVVDGIDKETGAQAWFSIGYLSQEHRKNDLETAIDAYDEAIRLKPDLAEAYNNRGYVKDDLGRYEAALADYDEAIRLKSGYAEAYNNRGVTKRNLGRYEAALADYDEAIRLKSDNAEAYYNRGIAKNDFGRHEEALADYDEAIRLKSGYAEAYNNRGVAKRNLGRHEAALADYDKAIRLKSDNAEAYYNRGYVKDDLGQYEAALADYDEAIRLKSDNAEAYNNRGVTKRNLGRHEAALADYDEAIRLKSDNAEAYYNRGNVNAFLNRIDEARQDFETVIVLARNVHDETLASDAERALKKLSDEQDP